MVEVQIGEGEIEALAYDSFEERVANGRIPPHARIRFEPVTGTAFEDASELDLYRSIRDGAAVAWRVRFANSGPPILTALLVGLQLRIWLWTHTAPGMRFFGTWLNYLPPALEDGQPWRMLTYGMLHTDFLHFLLNSVWMAYTGWNIERALGRLNLAVIFFFSVACGGLLSMFLGPNVPSLGSSGGVFGLVAASVVFGFIRQDLLPEKGRRLFGAALAPYLVLMFVSGLSNPSTDNWAHFGGLVCGGVLAFVLDPPGFERRRFQNRRYQLGGALGLAAVLLGLGLGGPWIHPLLDKEDARVAALPRAARARTLTDSQLLQTDLTWSVPVGWKLGTNASGDGGFRSPANSMRSMAIVQIESRSALTLEDAASAWLEKVTRAHPTASIERAPASRLAGREAAQIVVELDNGAVLEWTGTVQGVYTLYRVLGWDRANARRMRVLLDRAGATVDWREPLELQTARRNHASNPTGLKAGTELGNALVKWGELDEGVALLRGLVDARPEDPERWIQWLRAQADLPGARRDPAALEAALQQTASPEVVVEIASVLRAWNEPQRADGVLEQAWLHAPGDRTLKRAMRLAGLRWTLAPGAQPVQWLYTPTGERPAVERDRLLALPTSFEAAEEIAVLFAAEREELVQALPAELAAGRGIPALLRIRDGGLEAVFEEQTLLRRELQKVDDPEPPRWMSPNLRAQLDAATVEQLVAVLNEAPPTSP